MKFWQIMCLVLVFFTFVGCESTQELGKTVWGSTTRVLEDQRSNALVKTYDKSYWDCFRAAVKVVNRKKYTLFQKDEVRGFMVIMGIPGAVDTTEVGVFFVELADNKTRVELSSLSSNAKRLLAKGLFHGMDIVFGLIPPDKEVIITKDQFIQADRNGEDFFRELIEKGFLEKSSSDAGLLTKDSADIKEALEKEFPNEYQRILSILQKAEQENLKQQE